MRAMRPRGPPGSGGDVEPEQLVAGALGLSAGEFGGLGVVALQGALLGGLCFADLGPPGDLLGVAAFEFRRLAPLIDGFLLLAALGFLLLPLFAQFLSPADRLINDIKQHAGVLGLRLGRDEAGLPRGDA